MTLRITDDRGREHWLIGERELVYRPRWSDPAYRAVVEKAIAAGRGASGPAGNREFLVVSAVMSIVGIVMALGAVGANVVGSLTASTVGGVLILVGGTICIANAVMLLFGARGSCERAIAMRDALLFDAICPVCAAGLARQRPGDGGGVPCPECRAVWNAERIRRRRAFDDGHAPGDSATSRAALLLLRGGSSPVRDATGKEHYPISDRLRHHADAAMDGPLRERFSRARAELLAADRRRWVSHASFCIMFAVGTTVLAVSPGYLPLAAVVVVIPGAVFCFAIAVYFLSGNTPLRPDVLRSVMTKHRLCPACAADLSTAALDEDRRATCPDCGGVWRVPRECAAVDRGSG